MGPNQQSPQPSETPIQPQPVIGVVEVAVPPTSMADYNETQAKQSFMLGIIAIITSLIFSLIGIILGVISVISGIKNKNKTLTILGGMAIVLGICMTVAILFIVVPILKSTHYSGKMENYVSTNCRSGKYSFDYPAELSNKQEEDKVLTLRQLVYDKKDSLNNNTLAIIQVNCEYIGQDIISDPKSITLLSESFTSATNVEDILPEDFLTSVKSAGYTDITATPYKAYTSINIKNNAWFTDISGNYMNKKIVGKLIFALGLNEAYGYSVLAVDEVWTPNQTVWDMSIQSLKVE